MTTSLRQFMAGQLQSLEAMSSEMRPATREPRTASGQSYPMRVDLNYRLIGVDGELDQGSGQTMALSCTSVWIESDKPLRVGLLVELGITWPVYLDDKIPLRLVVKGRTVSADGNFARIEIARHEFRTRGMSRDRKSRYPAVTAKRTMTVSA